MRQPTSTVLRPTASAWLAAALAAVLAGVAFASGGYGQDVWAWLALPMLWVSILVLARPAAVRVSRPALLVLGLLVAWTVWSAAPLAWSTAPPQTALEVERDLLYVAFFGLLV